VTEIHSTVTFEGNRVADVELKESKAGGVYFDAVVLVNHGKDGDGTDRTPTRWRWGRCRNAVAYSNRRDHQDCSSKVQQRQTGCVRS
jgi:hypothetical protein